MIYWQLFLAFFIPGILGYGGGPATIPLVENEVVDTYGWMDTQQFSEMVAFGNALPGPIATKMAAYVGFMQGGVLGAIVALFATIAPSLLLMMGLMALLLKHKDAPQVKQITRWIRPIIVVLLLMMTLRFFQTSLVGVGLFTTLFLGILSLIMLEKWHWHPAFVILFALSFGLITTIFSSL